MFRKAPRELELSIVALTLDSFEYLNHELKVSVQIFLGLPEFLVREVRIQVPNGRTFLVLHTDEHTEKIPLVGIFGRIETQRFRPRPARDKLRDAIPSRSIDSQGSI